jgi:DNA-binding XRE family transcriptional regulator
MPKSGRRTRTSEEIRAEKKALYADLDTGLLTLGEAARRMRKIVRMTQKEYAEKILRIYPRVLMAIERDQGNPTLETLNKIGAPFGLQVSFVPRARLLAAAKELNFEKAAELRDRVKKLEAMKLALR